MADILRVPLVSHAQRKRPIAPVDYFSRPLTLGINPNARIAQLSDSAPQRMRRIHLDVYPNLLASTLALGAPATLDLPLRSGRVFESAPRKRWQPDSLQSQGLIVYDGPEAAIASISDSAPQRRKSISVEQAMNLLGNTLVQAPTLGLPNIAGRLDISAPRARPQSRVEALSRPLTLGINPNAAVLQQSESAPPSKRSAYGFDPPNLLLGTLAGLLGLPLNAGRLYGCDSAPMRRRQLAAETSLRPFTISLQFLLQVEDATHGHAADGVSLQVAGTLVVADAGHAHTADNSLLVQAHVLAVSDAAHGHSVESFALSTGTLLQLQDALHAHLADQSSLSQAHVLVVSESVHAHSADLVAIFNPEAVIVDDALHAHICDAIGVARVTDSSRRVFVFAVNRTVRVH